MDWYTPLKRALDVVAAGVGLLLCSPILLVVAVLVKATSRGPVLHWSQRVGRDNVLFRMPKFRTMYVGAPDVATHLLQDPARFTTPVGRLLRKASLDELPQLVTILLGTMSLVGPRPALHNQEDLIRLRTAAGVHVLTPGLTGWAQVNGRDELPIPQKVAYDAYYLAHRSLGLDLKILWLTARDVLRGAGVSH